MLEYTVIADAYERIEATTKRLEMTDLLVELLKKTPKSKIGKVVYLTQGKIYPDFVGLEIGVAEKLAVKALSRASGIKNVELFKLLAKIGDIGEVTEKVIKTKKQSTLGAPKTLTVERVYEVLDKMAKTLGSGAVDSKMALLAGLLSDASPKEAKYIMRTVTGNLRLGIADMTVLDALAIAVWIGNGDIVMIAGEFPEIFWLIGCGKVTLCMLERHEAVVFAVHDEEWNVEGG